jgi:hypothetical protein
VLSKNTVSPMAEATTIERPRSATVPGESPATAARSSVAATHASRMAPLTSERAALMVTEL